MLANGLGVGCKEEAERSDVDLLRALGYVEEAPESLRDDPARVRVVTYDPHRSQPGYNLYTEQHEAIAVLIDADGRVIRRFRDEGAAVWAGVEILPDGDLIVVGAERSGMFRRDQEPTGRYLLRMRWDGTIRWKRAIDAHHDVEPLPDGRMLTLEMQNRPIPAIDPSIPVRDDRILVLDGDGETLSAQSLYDLLEAGPIPFAFQHVPPRLAQLAELQKNASIPEASEDETDYIDLLHTNSLEIFDQPGLVGRDPIYQPDSLLVTIRNQDRIAVVGLEASELRWEWGEGELKGPHNAIWLENGNVLVFDNGLGRSWSRVVEVNPTTNAIVWEFDTLHRGRFYTATRGSAQRLANGNTLITNSEAGQAFEVSSFGVVVWEYWNPFFSMRGRRGLIGSMKRLDPDFVDSLIERFGAEASSTSAERIEATRAPP
jgi:hypothetical protein